MSLSTHTSADWSWILVQTEGFPIHYHHLHCSPEGEVLMVPELVGKVFTILREDAACNLPLGPTPQQLQVASSLVPVQIDLRRYTAARLLPNGQPQVPPDRAGAYALQKSDGSWYFVDKALTEVPKHWKPRSLAAPKDQSHQEAQTSNPTYLPKEPALISQPKEPVPRYGPNDAVLRCQPKEPPAMATKPNALQPGNPPMPDDAAAEDQLQQIEKPKAETQPKQSTASTANYGNSGDHGNSSNGACTEVSRTAAGRSGNSENYPITNLPNYPIPGDVHPNPPAKHPPSDVLDLLESTIAQYLVCSPAQRSVLALWILHTYTFQAAHFTPYLNIYSPLEESGKSTCMAILRSFCARPWWASGVSPAIFKKKVSVGHPTVLLDNWQTVFRGSDKNQFTGFLLNGCDQARDVASFDHLSETSTANLWQTFCPKAFAGLESLPLSLARHSIPIVLQRRKPQETVKSTFNLLVPKSTGKLTSWMERWATDHEERVATTFDGYELEGPILPGLSPHQQNCARALLALAEAIGGHWPQKARDALMEIFDDYNKGQISPTQLLSDIRGAFARRGNQERIFTAELLEDLHDLDDRTWHEYGKSGKPMTAHSLSAILRKHFGIYSRSQRRGQEKLRGYQLSDFLEAWERYLPSSSEDLPASAAKNTPTTQTKSKPSTKSMPSTTVPNPEPGAATQEPRQAKTTPKPPKSRLVSMSQPKTSAKKIGPNPGSRLKHFVAKTMRIFTAIWP